MNTAHKIIYNEITELLAAGLDHAEIAEEYSIGVAAVYKIDIARLTKENADLLDTLAKVQVDEQSSERKIEKALGKGVLVMTGGMSKLVTIATDKYNHRRTCNA